MKVLLDRLTETPQRLVFQVDTAWWHAAWPGPGELPRALETPLGVELRAHCMGEDLFLEGRVAGELGLECGRCLARYRHRLSETFRLVLEPAGRRAPADPEAAGALARDGLCLSEDVEAGWFQGTQIELDAFVREVIALGLPVQPLCREECAGLCPRCGADRNAGRCGCADQIGSSAFAALAALRRRGPPKGET